MLKYIVIFVEGVDDKRFFERVIQPVFEEKDYGVLVWTYQNEQPRKVRSFLQNIMQMGGCYIFTTDINNSPCITHKKQKVQRRFKGVDPAKIEVVIKEIESWYLSVINEDKCPTVVRRCCLPNTDDVDKEGFHAIRPSKFDSDTDFKLEILKYCSIEKAIQRNNSFRHFYEKQCC
jgi:hypothetical protein